MNKSAFTPLESERVWLRRFVDDDLPAFLAYANDPLVARYQSWDSHSEQEAREIIAKQEHVDPGVPGNWFTFAAEHKPDGQLMGHVALKLLDRQQAEIGFTFSRAFQGKGLAFEATALVLDYVFNELKLHRVIAIVDCRNHKSVALLERLGMRREGHFIQNIWFKGAWGDEYLYALLREEWLRRRSG